MARIIIYSLLAALPLTLASSGCTKSSSLQSYGTSSLLPTSALPTPSTLTSSCSSTVCADYINSCGQMYGGCFPYCSGYTWPTFTPPPCPTTTTAPVTSSCDQTLCVDYVNTCGQGYGGCYPACSGFTTPSFTDPGCPTTTNTPSTSTLVTSTLFTSTSSCNFVCADYFDDCGNTYGPGCYTSCQGQVTVPAFTTPSCSLTASITSMPTSGVPTSSCNFICRDYFDDCGNTYGPGCYTTCAGQSATVPTFTTPYCSLTDTTTSTLAPSSTSSCTYLCNDHFDDCGNTFGPGCYTSCPGQADPTFTTPYCSVSATVTPTAYIPTASSSVATPTDY